MFESDNSSFYQQETGIAEMKTIYEILKDAEGVYGARPSGAAYTTRLYPLTKDKAMLLLEVAGKNYRQYRGENCLSS